MHRIGSLITAAVFFASILSGSIGSLSAPYSEFSEIENRALAPMPSVELLRSAPSEYCAKLEEYLSDHFYLRDSMISAYTSYLLASGKKNVRGLLVLDEHVDELASDKPSENGEDFRISSDFLFSQVFTVVRNRCGWLFDNIDKVQKEFENVDFVYAVVPEKVLALSEGSPSLDDSLCLENLSFIKAGAADHNVKVLDMCSAVLSEYSIKDRAQMYYKTDFHWNDLGAYRTSELLAMRLAKDGYISPLSIPVTSDFYWRDLSDASLYKGDLSQRLTEKGSKEFIPFYMPADTSGMRYFTAIDGKEVKRSYVIASGIDKKGEDLIYNTVSTYNLPYIRIENDNALEDKRVLVLKDSMQNATTDYLSVLFKEVNIADPRFDSPAFRDIMEKRDIDLVLFIYHENNISTELMNYLKGE
ncbi:MAG: hypothetical protein IJM17_02300 [Firmicutes bacterium]|nr:hypothetical protein [Bacillota bacterium]